MEQHARGALGGEAAEPLASSLLPLHHAALLASRRDALILLAINLALAAWGWERPLPLLAAMLVGSVVLFVLLLGVLRQGQHAARALAATRGLAPALPGGWAVGVATVGTLPATLLVARLAWLGLGSQLLVVLLAALAQGWQLWFYLWSREHSPDPSNEEQS